MATRTISNTGGNWGDTSTWAEGAVPTSSDDVVATSSSGNLVVNVNGACNSFNMTNYTGTLSGTGYIRLSIAASTTKVFKLVAGMTVTWTGELQVQGLSSTAGTCQLTSAGKTINSIEVNPLINNTLITMELQDNLTVTNDITHINGTFKTNNYNITCRSMAFGKFTGKSMTLTLGTSTINLSGSTSPVEATNYVLDCYFNNLPISTLSSTTATINLSGQGAGCHFANKTFGGTINYTGGGTNGYYGGGTSGNINYTGTASPANYFEIDAATTVGTGKTWNINGNASNRVTLRSVSTRKAITATGTLSLTNQNISNIDITKTSGTLAVTGGTITNSTASGGATFNAIDAIDGGGNSGWNFLSTTLSMSTYSDMGISEYGGLEVVSGGDITRIRVIRFR